MTTLVQARDAIVTHIHTTLQTYLPTLPVFYENTVEVDVNTVGDQFVRVSVDFDHTFLATFSSDLIDRVVGTITFQIFTKEGKGTRSTLAIMDTLNAQMRHRLLGATTTGSCTEGRKESNSGWTSTELLVPFEYFTG